MNANKLIAYLALISGILLSVVAEYYSIAGLITIFSAAVIPVIVMGVALGFGKITATLWLKNNWKIASWAMRIYLLTAISILMFITGIGSFGFLSKAHNDQSLVSGDVISRIAIYDEKINTSRENIEALRKSIKQMDEVVDQAMARSTTAQGATRAGIIRRSQIKERTEILAEIESEQRNIASLNEARAPIAAEVRKVEAEVGPLKYIAQFIYGDSDPAILEKSVTWVILLIVLVFDPLAVILLIASQVSFQRIKEQQLQHDAAAIESLKEVDPVKEAVADDVQTIPDIEKPASEIDETSVPTANSQLDPIDLWNKMLTAVSNESTEKEAVILPSKPHVWETTIFPPVTRSDNDVARSTKLKSDVEEYGYSQDSNTIKCHDQVYDIEEFNRLLNYKETGYVQNEEQTESSRWNEITQSTQISDQDYVTAVEKSIDDMVDSVRKGILPFYRVPYELQTQVKAKLQDGIQNNSNNTP